MEHDNIFKLKIDQYLKVASCNVRVEPWFCAFCQRLISKMADNILTLKNEPNLRVSMLCSKVLSLKIKPCDHFLLMTDIQDANIDREFKRPNKILKKRGFTFILGSFKFPNF